MSQVDDQLNWNDYGACPAPDTEPPDPASSRDRNPYTGSGPIREFLVDRLMGWGISQANLIADDLLSTGVFDAHFQLRLTELADDTEAVDLLTEAMTGFPLQPRGNEDSDSWRANTLEVMRGLRALAGTTKVEGAAHQ